MPFQVLKTYLKEDVFNTLSIRADLLDDGAIKHKNKWYLFLNANYRGVETQIIDCNGVFAWNTYSRKYANLIKSVCLNDTEIHLFYRSKNQDPFTYLGIIKHIEHFDNTRGRTFFLSQIQNWEMIINRLEGLFTKRIFIKAYPHDSLKSKISDSQNSSERLLESRAASFQAHGKQKQNYIDIHKKKEELGLKGELYVIQYEKNRLINLGKADLAKQIEHVSRKYGDGLGYDVLSFNKDGSRLFIEVKTTTLSGKQDFYISNNELTFLKNRLQARIYRVYNFSENRGGIKVNVYSKEDFCDNGKLVLEPISFKVKIKDS